MYEERVSESIAGRILQVRSEIDAAARRCEQSPQAVRLIAVSKTVVPERMMEAYRAGQRAFGENKVQDYLDKKDLLPADVEWHFIGHLQTNKVKSILHACARGQLSLFHSLDRLDLIREIEKYAARLEGQTLDCLIQVNASGESSKGGFKPEEVSGVVKVLSAGSPVKIRGLMTIGSLTEDRSRVREVFRKLAGIRNRLQQDFSGCDWDILSMGMSGDYQEAIEEGSTLVRIGSAIFGSRTVQ